MRHLSILLIAACIGLPAYAQIYKWVDEKGVTQYGEKPPSEKTAKKLNIPSGSTAAADARTDQKEPQQSIQDKNIEFRKRQIAREEAEANEAKERADKQQYRRACMEAKDELKTLREATTTYRLNDKGERVYNTDAEHKAAVARFEAEYKANCK